MAVAKQAREKKKKKKSGHARLKAALVLRDALADELKIPLQLAAKQLSRVESSLGTARALDEGKYLDALNSICEGNTSLIGQLDGLVRDACTKAVLAPRYAQYLALLLFAYWVEAQRQDATAFLARLNAYLADHSPKGEDLNPFSEADLQFAAFWMATAAGKTHVLHACLALLESDSRWDRILLVTPSEPLTRQHADKLKALGQWDVFAYPMDGDVSALGRLSPDAIIVLDINKLAEEKQGEGVTISTSVFKDGRNLIFVDEGHKGQKTEASAWKRIQQDLAGIASPQLQHRGLLVEFSATFGQVAEAEHAFGRYAKSIILDYAYDRFHADLYGKDFWHVKLDSGKEAGRSVQRQTLSAALMSFWYQMKCYKNPTCRHEVAAQNVQVAAPLWVLLGLSVIGGKNKSDQEQTSDVVDVLRFLTTILERPDQLAEWVGDVVDAKVSTGADLLPEEVRSMLKKMLRAERAKQILADIFAWQKGDKPVFRLLKGASGELGLGLLRGEEVHYYGVVNVGDAPGLKKFMEAAKLVVDEDALSLSLFEGLGQSDSGVNILIGSRRFAEGWDNYRAASLTLLRLGQGEGSLIIQMFGRVVRFAGRNGDGKRLEKPSTEVKPLQTAFVYGLKSKYLETFLRSLYETGVPKTIHMECPTKLNFPKLSPLKSVQAISPKQHEFIVEAKGTEWLSGVNKIKLSLAAAVTTSSLTREGVAMTRGVEGEDLTSLFKKLLPIIDHNAIYREMVEVKRLMRWWNFSFDKMAICAALESNRYEVFGLPSALEVRQGADLIRLNRMATTLVRRLFEGAYRKHESRQSRYVLIDAELSGIPETYHKDFSHVEE
jgi:hypothetical protein